jgi:N-acetylmuramoyl-L-alanine amidase CwlA
VQHLQAAFEQWYGDCQRTLTEISYDQVRTLCVSEEKYIDFDWVAHKYFSGKKIDAPLKIRFFEKIGFF